jgi:hypothetical protein
VQNEKVQPSYGFDAPLRVFTAKQTAELLAVTAQVIYRLVRFKKLRPLAGFGRLRFSAAELSRFIAETK